MATKTLRAGDDTLCDEPNSGKEKCCLTCGDKMKKTANVRSATGWAEAMAGKSHLHDRFVCPNAGERWHEQVIALKRLIRNTPSLKLANFIQGELDDVLQHRKPSKTEFKLDW